MTFLNPAVLFGLIATAIPVLIHLLNLRKLKKIDFSTLTFLKELKKNKIRRIKLKQWLLLTLRFLIILFLVGAFARPAVKGLSIGGTTSAAKTTAVFIIDNTFSMSVVNEKGSYFNRAKQVINNLINQLQEGDEAALIPLADISQREIKTTTSLNDFKKQVDETEISFNSGTIHNAIIKAAKILNQTKNFNKEIYLLTDFQKSRLVNPGDEISDLSSMLNESTKLYMFDFTGKEILNVGIEDLEPNNQIFEKDKPVGFTAVITNYSKQSVNNLVASLFINGERSAQQSLNLGQGESKKILFETVLKSTGSIDVMAEIEDDDILQDNRRFISLNIPEKISVIIFSESPGESRFIRLALSPGEENKSIVVTEKNFNQITSVDLNSFNVAVLIGCNFSGYSDRLNSYLSNGGSVFLMPGSQTSFVEFQNAASKLQLPLPVSDVGKSGISQTVNVFDKTDFEHPIFSDIFEKNAKKQIESPDIYRYFKTYTQGKGRNIISLADNSAFLSEYKIRKGKLLLMTSAPLLSWNNLPLKGIFVPLIYKSVFYLASKDQQISSYIAGETVNINLQNNALPQVKILRPDKSEEYINLNNLPERDYIQYNKTDIAGNYKVYSGQKLIDYFAINPNPLESNITKLSSDEIAAYLKKINFKGRSIYLEPDENYLMKIQQARFGSELWRVFLVIAFLLALIEMIVARNTKKEIV